MRPAQQSAHNDNQGEDNQGKRLRARIASATDPRFRLHFDSLAQVILIMDAVVVIAMSVATGVTYLYLIHSNRLNVGTFLGIGMLVAANLTAILAACGAYRVENAINTKRVTRDVALSWSFVLLILLCAAFALKATADYSRGASIIFFFAGGAVIVAWRWLLAWLLRGGLTKGTFAKRRIILLGSTDQLAGSTAGTHLERYGYSIAHVFSLDERDLTASKMTLSTRVTLNRLIDTARAERIYDVLLLLDWDRASRIDEILGWLRVLPAAVHLVPDSNVARFLGTSVSTVGGLWTSTLQRAPLTRSETALKRLVDICLASSGLVLLAPVLAVTALLIKLDSSGPVLFRQTRDGFNGIPFRIFKFRTMSVLQDGDDIPQATRNDARVTRAGRWLRRTSIDELPQLFNVLRGEMSLVGPRPHAIAHNTHYEKMIANYALRNHVKPGITGLAQINGCRGETRSVETMERRLQFDLRYIENWSLWLDLKIIAETVLFGVWHPSAY